MAKREELSQVLLAETQTQLQREQNEQIYTEFNEKCVRELEQIHQNLINQIVSSGVLSKWDISEEGLDMKASYSFNTHEEAQTFVNQVGKLAETLEHHPEWSTSDEGRLVHIRLTTHDLGNRLGLKDF